MNVVKKLCDKQKDCLQSIKMRVFPPSSRSFHAVTGTLKHKTDKAAKKADGAVKLIRTRSKYLEWISYVILHQQMEERLRRKVEKGKKVKVVFLLQYMAKFECKTVYDAMERSDLFEPYLLITHPRDKDFEIEPSYYQEALKAYQVMQQRGYRTIFGYDENFHPISLEKLKIDILFWNNPNMFHRSHYQNVYLNANYLTCFVPYFFNSANFKNRSRYMYSCEHYQCVTAWKIFVESYPAFYQMVEKPEPVRAERPRSWIAINAVLSGYPKLDAYARDSEKPMIPQKINNGKPIVIYAPHWSIHADTWLSTFHLFNQQFMQLVYDYPDINFVYKPHPDLRNRIIDMYNRKMDITLTPEEYDAYVKEWDSRPNGILVDDGEYIDLFKASTCLITDCGSFISEYLPSGHPCIYILNPEKKDPLDFYNDFGRRIVESYYCCSDWDSIYQKFREIVFENQDPNKEIREEIVKDGYLNIGTAGQFICDYLEDLLTD